MVIDSITKSIGEFGFTLQEDGVGIYCPHVNGLTAYCLSKIGEHDLAKEGLKRFLHSQALDTESGLFYRNSGDNVVIDSTINYCKNVIMSLGLFEIGCVADSRKVINGLNESLLRSEDGFFYREFKDGIINKNIYPQSHFWHILTLIEQNDHISANHLLKKMETIRSTGGFFESSDCRITQNAPSRYYLDDQALYIWMCAEVGNIESARAHANLVLSEPCFFDENIGLYRSYTCTNQIPVAFSTYKNAILAIALAKIGYTTKARKIIRSLELNLMNAQGTFLAETNYNPRFAPDNNALYLYAKNLCG